MRIQTRYLYLAGILLIIIMSGGFFYLTGTYRRPPEISLTLHWLLGQGKLLVDLDLRYGTAKTAELQLARPGRDPLQQQTVVFQKSGVAQVDFQVADLPPGDYEIRASVKNEENVVVSTASLKFTRPEDPSWLGSKEGITDEVLSPWTPVEVQSRGDALIIRVWNRSYEFAGLPFPSSIETAGRSILAGTIKVVARIDGREVVWQGEPLQLERQTPAGVSFHKSVHEEALTLSGQTQVEYDGMIRIDWKIEPRVQVRLDELIFEVPIYAEYAKYFYYHPDYQTHWYFHKPGALPRDGVVMGFAPVLWLGDDDRGLMWFSESEINWYNAHSDQAVEIVRNDETVIMRLRLVDKPIKLVPGAANSIINYTFGLQATPVKPIRKDVWDYRIIHISQGTFSVETRLKIPNSTLDLLAELGVKTIAFHEHWTDIEAYTTTTYGDDLRKLVKACHERGIQLLIYFGFLLSNLTPEWPYYNEETLVVPRYGYDPYNYPPQPVQKAFTVCYRSVWQDALVDGIARLMDEYDLDGVYLDGTASLFGGCRNVLHGCGYKRSPLQGLEMRFFPDLRVGVTSRENAYIGSDGVATTYAIFPVRETLRRIYTVVKSHKPDGQVNVHQSAFMTPALAFATSYWDGEQLSRPQEMTAMERLPLDMFRTEFMGRQWGIPAEFLHYSLGISFQEGYAISLLHDVLVRAASLEDLELASAIWRIGDEFGRKETDWLPYWKNSEYVSVSPQGAYVSLYRHPKNGVLAVISNLGQNTTMVRVQLNLKKLALPSNLVARDALTGDPVPLEDGKIELALSPLRWKMIWVRP